MPHICHSALLNRRRVQPARIGPGGQEGLMNRFLYLIVAVVLGTGSAAGQTVSSSVNGILLDPSGAAIPGATCTLTRQGTGAVFTAISGTEGFFTFPNVPAGSYTLSVQQPGFKALEVQHIAITASEIRSLGRLTLE